MKKEGFNKEFLDLLVCPKTGQNLVFDDKKRLLITEDGTMTYKIIEGIPRLIID